MLTPFDPTRFERGAVWFLFGFLCFALLDMAFLMTMAAFDALGVI